MFGVKTAQLTVVMAFATETQQSLILSELLNLKYYMPELISVPYTILIPIRFVLFYGFKREPAEESHLRRPSFAHHLLTRKLDFPF